MDANTEVEVAVLKERVAGVQATVVDIQKDMKDQNKKLDTLIAMHNQRKGAQGALKLFMAAGGSSGFAALAAHLWDKFHP